MIGIKLVSFSLIILTIIFIWIYIYINEKNRIWKLINYYNSSIEEVHLTFTKTYLVNKKILYIRLFSSDYCIIHEIAHSFCNECGHTEQFYNIFNKLLKCYNY
jgi:predicted metal-dependent hydrolase